MSISANKGEWSELYVLLKLLGEKKVYAGDGQLNKQDIYYPILKIIRDELTTHMEYSIDKDIVVLTENHEEFVRINVPVFLEQSKILLADIQNGSKGTGAFALPSQDEFLKKIHCKKIKAKSGDKADINIVIHDFHTGLNPLLGFSIKSEVGNKASLLNPSGATIFTYEIDKNVFDSQSISNINAIATKAKIIDRVKAIVSKGGMPHKFAMNSKVFQNNLLMVDSQLPQIIAWLLIDSYNNHDMSLSNAVKRINIVNPLNYDLSDGHDFYRYKIKSLLVTIALGMKPATIWDGKYEATGGYLVVKEDGDIVCFHIYDRNLLEEYLFNNTRFETPKSDIVNPIITKVDDGKLQFPMGLQIRFL